MSTKSEQVVWRRSKIVEIRARGMSQIEIAHELQVSEASISCDIQYLRSKNRSRTSYCLFFSVSPHNRLI
jgi:predicted transcriptional regulator